MAGGNPIQTFFAPAQLPTAYERAIGKKQYEIQDHQKNVRVLISDEKLVADVNNDNVINAGDIFTPSVLSFNDFFPMGGMEMPGRTLNANTSKFGFQGQLKVDEVYGSGNLYSYKYRESDARKGGDFWSPDPLAGKYPECSPYAFSQRSVIDGVDSEGLEHYYTADGTFLEKIGNCEEVWTADKIEDQTIKYADGTSVTIRVPINPKNLGMDHTKFTTSANVVKHESSGDK